MASLLQQIKTARADLNKKNNLDIKIDIDIDIEIKKNFEVTINRHNAPPLVYKPEKSAIKYHTKKFNGDKCIVKHSMGPFGSGKSVRTIMDFLFDDYIPACLDGIVRIRTLMGRCTYKQLASTVIKTFLDWFGDTGSVVPGKIKKFVQSPYPVFHARFNIFNKNKDVKYILDWEVMFLAFETVDDADKLRSLDITNAFLNECCDLPGEVYFTAYNRSGRYPKRIELLGGKKLIKTLRSDTNPPAQTSWLYKLFEDDKPCGFVIFKQPPGAIKNEHGIWIDNPDADNLKNLPANYYSTMTRGQTNEYIRVYAQGQYGLAFSGHPVFSEYNDDWHSVDTIDFVAGAPLYLGWDFGLTPCLLVCQFINGQLRCIVEFVTESFGIENLIFERVKPYWQEHKLKEYVIRKSVADPAGDARSAKNINEPTLIQIISKNFTITNAAATNKEEPRLQSVRGMLGRNVNGKPMLLVSRKGCPILREGFNGKYYTKEVSVPGKLEKMITGSPVKSHPHSEPQDCLQYIALDVFGSGIKEISEAGKRIEDQIGAPRVVRL